MMKIAKTKEEQTSLETGIRRLQDDELDIVAGGHKNSIDVDLIDADIRLDPKIKL